MKTNKQREKYRMLDSVVSSYMAMWAYDKHKRTFQRINKEIVERLKYMEKKQGFPPKAEYVVSSRPVIELFIKRKHNPKEVKV